MKLLLDTHIWIWSLQDPARLANNVAAALTSGDNELWLSPISVWELLLLAERKRVEIKAPLTAAGWVEEAFVRVPLKEANLNRQVCIMSRQIAVQHEDPADRFLAATAAIYDLTLVTSDERLLRGKGFRTLDNRQPATSNPKPVCLDTEAFRTHLACIWRNSEASHDLRLRLHCLRACLGS